MIKLSKEDLAKHKGSEEIRVKMMCMICMTFPEIVIYKKNPKNWYQFPNPIPSNRLCFHIKHELECPCCEFGVVPEEKMQEMYFIEPKFKEDILKRDKYTCQACGYRQTNKPTPIQRRKKTETEADYLYRRFMSSLAKSGQDKSLIVAHYSQRYKNETYENRHRVKNARTLCVDCHNAETAKHQMESWLERMKECPWLNKLE